MKKLLTVLVVFVYFVPASLFLTFARFSAPEAGEPSVWEVFTLPIITILGVCALVAVSIACAARSAARLRCLPFRAVMVFKLCLIPFYIVNFVCWGFGSMVFHIALLIWPLIPFIVAYTYFTMLGTSAHIIAKLVTLRKAGNITKKQLIVHSLLQLTFALDVIDSIYLSVKQKQLEAGSE